MSHKQYSSLVIFDMDGTLTLSVLDFDRIREEIGLDHEPLLEAMARMSPADRARAEAILRRHEDEAASVSELQPHAAETVAVVRARGIPAALMTRNRRSSVDHFQRRHSVEFDLIWTRESGPMKPSPEPVLAICRHFNVAPSYCWVVGDFHFDILCGSAAGAKTVLFLEYGRERPAWADDATHVISDLRALGGLLANANLHPGGRDNLSL